MQDAGEQLQESSQYCPPWRQKAGQNKCKKDTEAPALLHPKITQISDVKWPGINLIFGLLTQSWSKALSLKTGYLPAISIIVCQGGTGAFFGNEEEPFIWKDKQARQKRFLRTGFHLPTITRKASPRRIIISILPAIQKVLLLIIFSGVPVCPAPHLNKADSSAFNQFANIRIHLRSKCLCSPHCICSCCPTALPRFPPLFSILHNATLSSQTRQTAPSRCQASATAAAINCWGGKDYRYTSWRKK